VRAGQRRAHYTAARAAQKANVMAKYTQATRLLAVATPLGADALLLTGFTGREGISRLFQFELELLAENNQDIPFDKLLGQPAAVRLALAGNKNRFISGIISRLSQGTRDQTFTRYRMEIVPQLWLLTRRAQSRVFQKLSVPDILKKVLDGLDVAYEIQGTFHPRDYCVQYRETDFAFASRLMEEEGIFYFFKHAANGHKMVVANTPASHRDLPEQSQAIFESVEGGQREEDRVHQWEKVQEMRSGKCTLWDYCFEMPDKNLEASQTTVDSVAVGKVTHKLKVGGNDRLELYDYPGGYAQRFDGIDQGGGEKPGDLKRIFEDNKRTVAIRMEQEALPGLVTQGAGNCRPFVSGHKFTLAKHFNADGPYVLTGVEHSATLSGDYRSGQNLALTYENRFTCIPLALPFRPRRETPRPRAEGTQTAVVVGPPGEEVYCDKYGRVKVQFHWDREGQNNLGSSCWIRVGTVWAGKRRGVVHVPMVGDEVIVDFLEGDPDQPIIIGSVYNAEMMPPYELPASKKTIAYKGSTGSNHITNDNTEGKELYKIFSEKDIHVIAKDTIYMDAVTYCKVVSPKIFLEAKQEINLSVGGTTITMKATDITLSCGASMIKMTAADITIDSPQVNINK
jgi:type VI secretion system secreted protein VgrG